MVKEEKEQNNVWTIDELVALTDDVQHGTVEYKGKDFKYQYCELTESEEPKFGKVKENMSEDDKFELYAKIGGKRVLSMILKANEKNPEGTTIHEDAWPLLPTTLRYMLSNEIMGIQNEAEENFQI